MTDLVFIYGTLKQGFPNYHLNPGTRVQGEFATLKKYPFYLVGERNSPWLLDSPGTGKQVSGELYRVDTATLATMDILERVDQTDGYRRKAIDVVDTTTNRTIAAYVYFHQQDDLKSDVSRYGPLVSYEPIHAKRYRRRSA